MARTKEFDPAAALDVAMTLFWRYGYEGTSTAQLVEATGVARASLYATFGGKHELYTACLDRYLDTAQAPEEVVAMAATPIEAIRTLLELSPRSAEPDCPTGCFSVNATVEHGATDAEIGRRLENDRQRIESALRTVLLRGQRDGSVRADLDAVATARLLLSTMTGMRSIARAGSGQRSRLDDTVTAAMHLITT